MRIIPIPAPENDRNVNWERVTGVRYLAQGRQRWIVLTYANGGERRLEIHQARDLYYQIASHRGCEAPCYRNHECDTAPPSCAECLLAQTVSGVVGEVRPDPIPPRRLRPPDPRNWIIVGLAALVLLLADAARKSPTPPPIDRLKTPSPRARIERGEGRGLNESSK